MSDDTHARGAKGPLVPDEAERARRRAGLVRQEAELRAEIARRRKIRIAIALALPVAAALVWFGVAVVRRVLARAEVEAELAKIRARGEPVTMADLEPPPVPDEDNAAPLLAKAYACLQATEDANGDPFDTWVYARADRRRFPEQTTQAECARLLSKAMVAHAETLRLAHEAARRPVLRFELEYAGGEWMSKEPVCAIRSIARLLAAEALWAAQDGRLADAVASLVAGMKTARLALKQQVPGEVLFPISLWQMTMYSLPHACGKARFSDDMRRTLMQGLADMDFARAAEGAMILARADMIEFARRSLDEPSEDHVGTVEANGESGFLGTLLLRDEARCLRWMAEAVAATRLPPWQARPALAATRRARDTVVGLEMNVAPVSVYAFPAIDVIYGRVLRAWAARDVAQVGLALELHRSEKGEYPTKLDALAPEFLPEVPPDPYTGKPLVYRVEGDGFLVYSIGENLQDDGGRFDPRNWKLDVPWTGGEFPTAGGDE
ncbi:MAG: hypothetical protein ACYTKD_21525 [Planctomycetota bacterium]|jgi:hypothetical protein